MNDRTNGAAELVELTRWVQSQIEQKRSRVVLRQRATSKARDQRIKEWRLANATTGPELAAEIYARALDDARQQRGPGLYSVHAYLDGETHNMERMLFCVDVDRAQSAGLAALDTGGDDHYEDSITLDRSGQRVGVVGLLMRHTHASAQLALGHIHDIVRHYKAECERKDERIRELEDRHLKTMAMHEELLSMKHEREMEKLRMEGSEKRKDQFFEKLEQLAPLALAKFVGPGADGKLPPALGEEMMRQLLGSLKPEQLDAISRHLGPEQQALIYQIYLAYAEREEAKKQAKANGASSSATSANGSAQ